MAEDTSKQKVDEEIARAKKNVEEEVKQHKDEDPDLQDVVGGAAGTVGESESLWKISYET